MIIISHPFILALGTKQCSRPQAPDLRGCPRMANLYEMKMNAYIESLVFSQVGHLGLADPGRLLGRWHLKGT